MATEEQNRIAPTAIIYPGVTLGGGCVVGDYCIIGHPAQGEEAGASPTVVGPGAIIRSHTVIYAGNTIGARFATGHGALLREANTIGDDVSIGSHTVIEHRVVMGDRVRVHSSAFIPEFSLLEDDSWVGPHVIFTNVLHPKCPDVAQCIKGPTLRRGAKIGANASVLPTVVVGEMAIVAAGSVVVRDVPDRMVAAGNPARVVKNIDDIKCPWDYIARPYPLAGEE